jgi:signal transduction histidine kinase
MPIPPCDRARGSTSSTRTTVAGFSANARAAGHVVFLNGTGLGVVIARSIVRQHGGALTYASRPEGGTIATIELPVRGAQPPFRL